MADTQLYKPDSIFSHDNDELYRWLIECEMGDDGNEFTDGYIALFLLKIGELSLQDGFTGDAEHIAQILFERSIAPSKYGDQTEYARCFNDLDARLLEESSATV